MKRAIKSGAVSAQFYDPKKSESDIKKRVDDKPYGGGPGQVIRALPVVRAIEKAQKNISRKQVGSNKKPRKAKIIFLSPSGKQFSNVTAVSLAKKFTDIIVVSGRYEGIDARVKKIFKMDEISVGPFVLTGGELPAMIIMDAVSRRVPGVLGNADSLEELRVASPDVYTRPGSFLYKGKNYRVPKLLLSGNHAKIEKWRNLRRTRKQFS